MKIIWTGGKKLLHCFALTEKVSTTTKYGLLRVAIYQGAQLYRILSFLCNQTPFTLFICITNKTIN